MKKLLSIAVVAALIAACNDNTTSKEATSTDTTAVAPAPDTAMAAPDTASAASATPAVKDGLMAFKDGKVMVAKGGNWEPLKATFTCTNGRKVSPNGEVSKNGKKRKLTEGMMIDKDGQMMDKDGKMLDTTGWE